MYSKKILLLTAFSIVMLIITACYAESSVEMASSKSSLPESEDLESLDLPDWFTSDFLIEIEKKYDDLKSDVCEGMSIPTYTSYIGFADVTDDGIPEVFCGYGGVNERYRSYFTIYSMTQKNFLKDQNNEYIRTIETADINEDSIIITGNYYISNDGTKYYESALCDYEGMQLEIFVRRFWYDGSRWQTEYNDLSQDVYENADKSYPLATAVQEIDRVGLGFEGSIINCYKLYEARLS